jgi:hypothetical protein
MESIRLVSGGAGRNVVELPSRSAVTVLAHRGALHHVSTIGKKTSRRAESISGEIPNAR